MSRKVVYWTQVVPIITILVLLLMSMAMNEQDRSQKHQWAIAAAYEKGYRASEARFYRAERIPMWLRSMYAQHDRDIYARFIGRAPSVARDYWVLEAYHNGMLRPWEVAVALDCPQTVKALDCLQHLHDKSTDQNVRIEAHLSLRKQAVK